MKIGLALKQEIEHTFQVVPYKGNKTELCFVCPEPGCGDKTGHRSVNLLTGATNCFKCNKGGNFIAWAMRLGYRFSNADDVGAGGNLKELIDEEFGGTSLPPVVPVELPKGFIPITDEPESVYTRLITEMAVRKNLTYEDMVEAGAGFTRDSAKWEEYAIFPVYEYGVQVYYQGRTYVDKPGESTKLFPSREELKFGARYWVYNIDELRTSKAEIAIVVESILNVSSLRWKLRELGWENQVVPVCVFKHKVSREQWMKLCKLRYLKEVCLMFDHDAIELAWESSRGLTNQKVVTVAEMPLGPDGNKKLDANDDVETAIDVFEKRELYTPGTEIMKKILATPDPHSLAGQRSNLAESSSKVA